MWGGVIVALVLAVHRGRVVRRQRVLQLLRQAVQQRHRGRHHVGVLGHLGLKVGQVCHCDLLVLLDGAELAGDA